MEQGKTNQQTRWSLIERQWANGPVGSAARHETNFIVCRNVGVIISFGCYQSGVAAFIPTGTVRQISGHCELIDYDEL